MAIANLNKAAQDIIRHQDEADILARINETAMKNSLLIFLTDETGEVLYSVDEYSTLYSSAEDEDDSSKNPYHAEKGSMSWEQGAIRNLPYSHRELIAQLSASGSTGTGYTTSDGSVYVSATRLDTCFAFPEQDVILCISMPLGSVDAATGILQVQLIWVSVLSFVLAFVLAFFLARRFEKPIQELAFQARRISQGSFNRVEKAGFCTELDDLAETLNETAHSLERLEASRRELLAGVSHDLRTPLTMMKGYAEMLQEFSWKDEQTRNHDLAVIQREADRLTALVNEILEYSSMQSNGLPLHMEEFDMSETADCVAAQFDELWKAQGYVIEKTIEPGLRVQGDRRQLERVIYNFMDNAVNHAGMQKHIVVKLCAANSGIRFSVQDFGAGIPEEEIPYIWEKYYTARNRKKKDTVSGLGLSIAKEILNAHKAKFGVSCEDGCEFWFEMPRQA
ncbi:MAG: sensor histidine kinase [Oscillospiraceae bacterium]